MGESVAKNPVVFFEEVLPKLFGRNAILILLGLEVTFALKESFEALQLLTAMTNGNQVFFQCSALSKLGIADIWRLIVDYQNFTLDNNFFNEHRKAQSKYWLTESIDSNLKKRFLEDPSVSAAFGSIEQEVLDGKLSPFLAAERLLNLFFK